MQDSRTSQPEYMSIVWASITTGHFNQKSDGKSMPGQCYNFLSFLLIEYIVLDNRTKSNYLYGNHRNVQELHTFIKLLTNKIHNYHLNRKNVFHFLFLFDHE